MILSLQYQRSPARYLASKGITSTKPGRRFAGMVAGNISPLRLVNLPAPDLPGEGWTRVVPVLSGICGSDLGLLTGQSSPYLSPVTSMPFVPGHEVVGETLDEVAGIPAGSRVVLDPVLSCEPRGTKLCRWCTAGQHSRCDHITTGRIAAGLQTGFCADTGGGWSRRFVAHHSQLHVIPDELTNERAVLVEPLACAVHSVRRIQVPATSTVAIIGAGTVGLMTLLALKELAPDVPVHVVAKHKHQQDRALELGAAAVHQPDRATRAIRRTTTARMHVPEFGSEFLLGGVDIVFECTGGATGLDTALRLARAGGTVVVSGMPSGSVDLTPLWFRELTLLGAYASGSSSGDQPTNDVSPSSDARTGTVATGNSSPPAGHGRAESRFGDEDAHGVVGRKSERGTSEPGRGRPRPRTDDPTDFHTAMSLAASAPLDDWVEPPYPLRRWREALAHAIDAGKLGSVKIAFAPGKD